MAYQCSIRNINYVFEDLKTVLAKASPLRSGDVLAGVAAATYEERVAAQMALADIPLKDFLQTAIIDYDSDEVTRLIMDTYDKKAFSQISYHTVGSFRDWLLSEAANTATLTAIAKAVIPEIAAAVSKIMRNQDLITVAQNCEVVTRFRTTVGLKGHLSTRLQPNHPFDDEKGIMASIIDGLLLGNGDAVIGINPATDNPQTVARLLLMLEELRIKFNIPVQSCVLSHVTTTLQLIKQNAPVDLVFQSVAGTQKANASFGISLSLLQEAYDAALSLNRNTATNQIMYFETGQGAALSSNANEGIDQQTCEARAYAVARHFNPFLVNSVVGFIGPEYLYDGKQIIRAGLEDHFCAKLMGLPMGMDVCCTSHAETDQDDMDTLLTLLSVAGCNFFMGVPGADDIMLHYQSTSYHDALYARKITGKKPAPEFTNWLYQQGITNTEGGLLPTNELKTVLLNSNL
ncbi:MAG: ethanolamine ammonia-lyase subunit EutB [Ferruginibacter sp.]